MISYILERFPLFKSCSTGNSWSITRGHTLCSSLLHQLSEHGYTGDFKKRLVTELLFWNLPSAVHGASTHIENASTQCSRENKVKSLPSKWPHNSFLEVVWQAENLSCIWDASLASIPHLPMFCSQRWREQCAPLLLWGIAVHLETIISISIHRLPHGSKGTHQTFLRYSFSVSTTFAHKTWNHPLFPSLIKHLFVCTFVYVWAIPEYNPGHWACLISDLWTKLWLHTF